MTTAYPFGTVFLEAHRGPITKGCGMTETPIDQGFRRCKCPACAPSLHREDGPDCCVTGDSYCPPCTLPERADMPRIMDERNDQRFSDAMREVEAIFASEREPLCVCGHDQDAHAASHDMSDHSCGECSCRRFTRTDTRTRAQLDDGCVTGCSCNGSQVTS